MVIHRTLKLKDPSGSGLINGKGEGTLDPNGSAIRAEVAAMMMRFHQSLANN